MALDLVCCVSFYCVEITIKVHEVVVLQRVIDTHT